MSDQQNICAECPHNTYNRLLLMAEDFCPYCKHHFCEKHVLVDNHNCVNSRHTSKRSSHRRKQMIVENMSANLIHSLKNVNIDLSHLRYNFSYVLLVCLVGGYFLASKSGFGVLFDWIAFASGVILILRLFLRSLQWANRVDLSSDLNYFGLKILAVGVIFAISFMYVTQLQRSVTNNFSGLYVEGLVWLAIIALFILALFLGVRTNRRAKMIGIWQ